VSIAPIIDMALLPVVPLMRAEVAVVTDAADNIKPAKNKSTERIDGIAAVVNALARAIVVGDPEEAGVFFA
jgi:phage terminase large subunit-like protein